MKVLSNFNSIERNPGIIVVVITVVAVVAAAAAAAASVILADVQSGAISAF